MSGPALLLGLLAEPECRAALRLARAGIDAAAVRTRWAQLGDAEICSICSDIPPAAAVSPFEPFLSAARQRLADFPRPLVFATEHLLLGLVAAEEETSRWLRGRGMECDAMLDEIRHIYGHVLDQAALTPGEGCSEDAAQSPALAAAPRDESIAILRILDAAANRAREGLRVVEDYVRFACDDRHLTEQLKRLRHELANAMSRLPAGHCLAARRPRPTWERP